MLREDVDDARGAVEALPPIPPRNMLLDRLDAVRAAIDKQAAIAAAIAAIDALPSLEDLTLDDKAEVQAARGLVDTAKDDHSAADEDITNLAKLIEAEARITLLETSFTITFDSAGGTPVAPITQLYGTPVTAPADPLKEGHTFTCWSPALPAAMPAENLYLTAQWELDSYTLTYSAGANGAIIGPSPQTVDHGAAGAEVTAVADEGYHFVKWSDGLGTASRTDADVTGDLTVTAAFAINVYTVGISAEPEQGGTVGGGGEYTHGSEVTVTAGPAAGYEFVDWTEDGVQVSTSLSYTFTAGSDRNLKANFSPTNYWFYEEYMGVWGDFYISLRDLPGATHYEFWFDGQKVSERTAVDECVVLLLLVLEQDPAHFEIRLFGAVDAEVPLAIAGCGGAAGDKFGKLIVHDTWSLEAVDATVTAFRVYADVPGATYYKVFIDGDKLMGGNPLDRALRSLNLMYSEPSRLTVGFYSSADDGEPIASAVCIGADGDVFGLLNFD